MIGSDFPYTASFVEQLIPQKFPFVLVDALYSYSETELKSGFTIPENHLFVQNGQFLESGIVEHMAQSVALHTGFQFYQKQQAAPTGYIGSISKIEISELPEVGSELQSQVTILQEFAGITLVDVVTFCGNQEIAKGQLKTVLAK